MCVYRCPSGIRILCVCNIFYLKHIFNDYRYTRGISAVSTRLENMNIATLVVSCARGLFPFCRFFILKMLVKQVSVSLVFCPRDDIPKRSITQLRITFFAFLSRHGRSHQTYLWVPTNSKSSPYWMQWSQC